MYCLTSPQRDHHPCDAPLGLTQGLLCPPARGRRDAGAERGALGGAVGKKEGLLPQVGGRVIAATHRDLEAVG